MILNYLYLFYAFNQLVSSSELFHSFLFDSYNDSLIECSQLSCSMFNELESFADFLPPPPWPPFKSSWLENDSFNIESEDNCNFCHNHNQQLDQDSEISYTQSGIKSTNSWPSALLFSILATFFFLSCFFVVWIKHKK